jgi:transaldolase
MKSIEDMAMDKSGSLAESVHDFLLKGFTPHYGERGGEFAANPVWQAMRQAGSELWLDTGDIEEISKNWTREFTAVTTNNTLLNKEVQTGRYDEFIVEAAEVLKDFQLDDRRRRLELAFMLNAHHALRLVEKFDAFVSVEEHTDLADNVGESVEYALRYWAICPERFFVKIPFTPAGLLATRLVSREGVAVNHTLGFSARQNYVIARIGRPRFVNVFLGRLNQFIIENKLGDGAYVGERTTVASQETLRRLRRTYDLPCHQIAASFRDGQQVRDLAGVDVLTMPAKVAKGFLDLGLPTRDIANRSRQDYKPSLAAGVDPASVRLETLWEIGIRLATTVDELEKQADLDHMSPSELVSFFGDRGCGDFLVPWTDQQRATSAAEGKIPRLENWHKLLEDKVIGLDSLMNLAGLSSFIKDQEQMDQRVEQVLSHQLQS